MDNRVADRERAAALHEFWNDFSESCIGVSRLLEAGFALGLFIEEALAFEGMSGIN